MKNQNTTEAKATQVELSRGLRHSLTPRWTIKVSTEKKERLFVNKEAALFTFSELKREKPNTRIELFEDGALLKFHYEGTVKTQKHENVNFSS